MPRNFNFSNNKGLIIIILLILIIYACNKSESLNEDEFLYDSSISLKAIDKEFIEIEDFENPESMWLESNKLLYDEAYNRFMDKVKLNNGLFSYNIKNGKSIGIAENIFDYLTNHIAFLNSQVKQDKAFIVRSNQKYEFYHKDLIFGPENFSTSSEIPPFCCPGDPVPIWDEDGGLIVNRVGSAMATFRNGNSQNFGSHFLYNGFNYNRTGTAMFGGAYVIFHVSSSTSVYSTSNVNNAFISYRETAYGTYTYFEVRNNQGNTLMSIRASGSTAAQDVRDELHHRMLYNN